MSDFIEFIERNNFEVKNYQIEGVKWCVDREINGYSCKGIISNSGDNSEDNSVVDVNDCFGSNENDINNPCYGSKKIFGGILADEMGLGKTIQIMGVILNNFKAHTLIVLPYSLLSQWEKFFISTAGHQPLIYHKKYKKISIQDLYNSPIVLTTYGILSSDKSILNLIQWDRIVYDEAHYIRNKKTIIYNAVLNIKSKIVWLVTGTPIVNNINDIYYLLSVFGIDRKILMKDDELMRIILSNISLRRTKKSVGIILPDVIKHNIVVDWTNIVAKNTAMEIHRDCLSKDPQIRLPSYIRSRKSCIDVHYNQDSTKDFDIHKSDKITCFMNTILSNKDNGKRKIVFCNFYKEIDSIKLLLQRNGFNVANIDGRVSSSKRYNILKDNDCECHEKCQCEENIDVLIMQIKTGSEGLNLQSYSEIYFLTPYWTPFLEQQAIARCHRIGQINIIDVFYFTMQKFVHNDNDNDNDNNNDQNKKPSIYDINIENHILLLHQNKLKIMNDLF